MTRQQTQRGSAALMAIVGLLLLGGLGATAVHVVSSNEQGRAVTHQQEQAYAAAQAGIEFAKNRIDQGANPVVYGMPIGQGTFTVAATPNAGSLIVTGNSGPAKKTYGLTTQFGKDCVDIDTTQAVVAADNITGLKLYRNCLSASTITMWQVTWAPDAGEKLIKIQIQGSPVFTVYDDAIGKSSGQTTDGADYTLSKGPGVPEPINKMQFNQNLPAGKTYTFTLYLADGSTVTRSFIDQNQGQGQGQGQGGPQGFTVNNGVLNMEANKQVTVNALCKQITYGANGPAVPVKAWYAKNNQYSTLFNGANIAQGASQVLNTGQNGGNYKFKANAKYQVGNRVYFNATYESTNTAQVKTLVNGDTPPPLAGFGGQQPVAQCVAGYMNQQTGKMSLSANQAILLFELGVNMSQNPNSPAADFQDLVLLITVD